MSKIETYKVCTNLNENHRAPRIIPSAHDWENTSVHDKDRGTVIAFAKLIENSLLETFPVSCIPAGSRREDVNHCINFAKYLLASINLLECSQATVNHSLNVLAGYIYAFLTLPGVCRISIRTLWSKNVNALRYLG